MGSSAVVGRESAGRTPYSPVPEQRPANYSQEAASGPPLVFLNKVLLEHTHAHSFTYHF